MRKWRTKSAAGSPEDFVWTFGGIWATFKARPKAPGNELLSLTTKVPGALSFSIAMAEINKEKLLCILIEVSNYDTLSGHHSDYTCILQDFLLSEKKLCIFVIWINQSSIWCKGNVYRVKISVKFTSIFFSVPLFQTQLWRSYLWNYVMVMIVCQLDLQLPMQSLPNTAVVVSSNPTHGKVYSIQHHVIKFVGELHQFIGFIRVLQFPPPIKLIATI